MILFKVFQQFLFPSVFIFLVILAAALLLLFKKKKSGIFFLVLGITLYYFLSISPIVNLILAPLEKSYSKITSENLSKADKIVFLLGGREADTLRSAEVLRIYNQNKGVKIIISGTDPTNPESKEAKEVALFLEKRGILPESIILEERSRTTRESAQRLKETLKKEPFFLVTSAYHMPRAIWIFKKLGTNPIPAPADFKGKNQYNFFDLFPNAENLRNSDLVFHEYLGILFYKLF